ncbi:hypothetical protein OROGR_018275 [Orobanche gracilis]
MGGRKVLIFLLVNQQYPTNALDAINFANMAWKCDVKSTTILNCFRHCKIRSEEDNVFEEEVGDLDEDSRGLSDVISNLRYRSLMDVKYFLNYPSDNDTLMESSTDEEIIQSVLNNDDDENDENDSDVIPIVSSNEAFQALVTLNNYLL